MKLFKMFFVCVTEMITNVLDAAIHQKFCQPDEYSCTFKIHTFS